MQTYDELTRAIAGWLNRSDLDEQIPQFIALAHQRIFRSLRVPSNEKLLKLYNTSTNYIDIPPDLLEIKQLTIGATALRPVSAIELLQLQQQTPATPASFARIGKQIHFDAHIAERLIDLLYWHEEPQPSGTEPSNDTLRIAPGLYLYGALCEAAPYLLDDARIPVWEGKYNQIMTDLQHQARRAELSGHTLQIKGAY